MWNILCNEYLTDRYCLYHSLTANLRSFHETVEFVQDAGTSSTSRSHDLDSHQYINCV